MASRFGVQQTYQWIDQRKRAKVISQRVVVAYEVAFHVVSRRQRKLLAVGSMGLQQIDIGDLQLVQMVQHRLIESASAVDELLHDVPAI